VSGSIMEKKWSWHFKQPHKSWIACAYGREINTKYLVAFFSLILSEVAGFNIK
jgi:hypothetical protein